MIRADQEIAPAAPPAADTLHARVVGLDLPEASLASARALLSADEIGRADAFLRRTDRDRFTAARAWLRRVLGACLGRPPAALVFREGPHGKPRLDEGAGRLDFNLSHSGGRALLVLSPGFAIGADIEFVRPIEEKIAERFFSSAEVRALAALDEAQRTQAFFRCWTRKEAYLKALGSGLATPLDGFTVSLGPTERARLLDVAGDPDEARSWQLAHLDLGPDLAGAVAARRRGWTIRWPQRP